jgi:hypothetical protein
MRNAHIILLKNLLTVTTMKPEQVYDTTSEELRMWYGLNWLRIVANGLWQHLV